MMITAFRESKKYSFFFFSPSGLGVEGQGIGFLWVELKSCKGGFSFLRDGSGWGRENWVFVIEIKNLR